MDLMKRIFLGIFVRMRNISLLRLLILLKTVIFLNVYLQGWKKSWVLLFVGKYLWTKGIQMVISALPIVLNAVPDLHLLLVGFGSYREELEALVYALAALAGFGQRNRWLSGPGYPR